MRIITMAAATALTMGLAAVPAQASDNGLFGSQDATFDGVYRQSLSILALTAADKKVPKASVAWLLKQQCKNGSFTSYRADTTKACVKYDAASFSGVDSNATSLAASALWAVGERKAARKTAQWLLSVQRPDGGWNYNTYSDFDSDTNSTSLVVGALQAIKGSAPKKFLRKAQIPCSAPKAQRGAFAYDLSNPAGNDNATSQAAWALTNGLALPRTPALKKTVPAMTCNQSTASQLRNGALGHMAGSLSASKGALSNGFGGIDYAGAASATVALANAGVARKAVRQTSGYLAREANTWATDEAGQDSAGALAFLILVADATKQDPTSFGKSNLIKRLAATRTR